MSLLTCDGLHDGEVCPEEFGGDVDLSPESLAEQARAEGWRSDGDRHFCPGCKGPRA